MSDKQFKKSQFNSTNTKINSVVVDAKVDHISICVCTYMRPQMLSELINALLNQKTQNLFCYSIIIVDNDPQQSGKEIVERYMYQQKLLHNSIEIKYEHMPVKGITYARNKSLESSTGDYVAFIDDDEVPEVNWLYQLYKTLKEYDADAVFGTVYPKFENAPPRWVTKHNFFYWRDVRRGTGLDVGVAFSTNNALVRRDLILKHNLKFKHDYAFIGGEDQAFFFSLQEHKKDAKLISCHKAVVHESLSSARCNVEYIRKRLLLEGTGRIFSYRINSDSKISLLLMLVNTFVQSIVRITLLYILFLFFFYIDRDSSLKYYYKTFYHIGILSAFFNRSPYSDRKSIGLL